jgi:hypothetical protein
LQLRVYPAADHGLRSPDKNYLPDFMWQLDQWLLDEGIRAQLPVMEFD